MTNELKYKYEPPAIKQTLEIKDIVAALHNKAIEQTSKTDYTIQNTAIETENGKSRFYGPGQHQIIAIEKNGKNVDFDKAFEAIKTYVNWFAGPDVADKLKKDQLLPFGNDEDKQEQSKNEKNDSSKEDKDVNNESTNLIVPSFRMFINEADNKNDQNKKDDNSDNNVNAKACSLQYELEINGMQKKTIGDTANNLIKNITNMLLDIGWTEKSIPNASGASSGKDRDGKFKDFLSKPLDADKVLSEYNKEIEKKFKTDDTTNISTIQSTKVLRHYLKKFKAPSNAYKLLDSAEYAICTKVDKNYKTYSLFQKDVIADLINKAIKKALPKDTLMGFLKKFKNGITKDNVILVNNYKDKQQKKDDKIKFNQDKSVGTVEDSLKQKYNNQLIIEDILASINEEDDESKESIVDNDKIEKIKKLFKGQINNISDKLVVDGVEANIIDVDYDAKDEILKKCKDVDFGSDLSKVDDAKFLFYVKLKPISEDDEDFMHEPSSESIQFSNMMNLLFEAKADDVGKFSDKIVSVVNAISKENANSKDDVKAITIDNIIVGNNKTTSSSASSDDEDDKRHSESIEDYRSSLMQLLFEKSNSKRELMKVDQKKFEKFIEKLKTSLKNIRKNKQKIIDQSYKNSEGKMLSLTKEPEYDKFIDIIFGEDDFDTVEKKLRSLCFSHDEDGNPFRNGIVYRFNIDGIELDKDDGKDNKVKTQRTDLDFYIIPIPGMTTGVEGDNK